MEINVTELVEYANCARYSASAYELGPDAAKITWNNAIEACETALLVDSEDEIEELIDWLEDFGAWTREEIEAYSEVELNALLLQFIAGDIREYEDHFDSLEAYQEAQELGVAKGNLWYCPHSDEWTFYIGT
jgi:hypothetical protein